MVAGVDRFGAHFSGHEHQYVLIGGAACELIMEEAGLDFRATKDLDIGRPLPSLRKSACWSSVALDLQTSTGGKVSSVSELGD